MRRIACMIALLIASSTGCRSFGRFPEIDPTDYAYSYFKGKSTQVYPYSPPQVEGSTSQALKDLGYKSIEAEREGDVLIVHAKTLDHRPVRITIRPRNDMTLFSVRVGIEGDEQVSKSIIERVAENMGALPRLIIPMEPALARRMDPPWPRSADQPPVSPPLPPAPPADLGPFAPMTAKVTTKAPKAENPFWFRLTRWMTGDEDEIEDKD